MNIKPQNQGLVLVIFILGGLWGTLENERFKGVLGFVIDGFLILVLTVVLGNITNYIFKKLGLDILQRNEKVQQEILDFESQTIDQPDTENKKDKAAL
ncbi:MAG: hypothetical protein AAFN93_21140, partial [Bacteroidota bacterium]